MNRYIINRANLAYSVQRRERPEPVSKDPLGYIPVCRGGQGRPDMPRPAPIRWGQLAKAVAEWTVALAFVGLAVRGLVDVAGWLLR